MGIRLFFRRMPVSLTYSLKRGSGSLRQPKFRRVEIYILVTGVIEASSRKSQFDQQPSSYTPGVATGSLDTCAPSWTVGNFRKDLAVTIKGVMWLRRVDTGLPSERPCKVGEGVW